MTAFPFCRRCGERVIIRVPDGDNRDRHCCDACGYIHYENPKNVVGCLLHWQGKVLLCKRAIEPRHGFWTLPAGFMENRESTREGAAREAREEANAECDELRLFAIYNLPRISQVYMMYVGELRNGLASAGEETSAVGLFDESEIPWGELAFPIVHESLERWFATGGDASTPVHCADIFNPPGAPPEIVRHRG